MAHAPTATLKRRHSRIRKAMVDEGLDALVVTSLPNVLYLTHFTGTSAIAMVTATQMLFLTDSRYLTAVADMQDRPYECPGLRLERVDSSYDETLTSLLSSMAPAAGPSVRVGFESAHVSVARHEWLVERLRP